jgi:hypothetical protein
MRLALIAIITLGIARPARGSQLPAPWSAQPDTTQYQVSVDSSVAYSGHRSLRLEALAGATSDTWTAVRQAADPSPFRGHRLRLTAAGRTVDVGRASIWLRIEGLVGRTATMLAFDNMEPDRTIGGTTEWTSYEIVLDVPAEASVMVFGPLLVGPGRFWIDQFRLEQVDQSIPTTNQVSGTDPVQNAANWPGRYGSLAAPRNLDFED